MKRFFDIFVAVAACLVLALPMLLVAILVKLTSRGPVLYWSDRVGQDNRIFSMPKFRSMKTGTPAVATHLLTDSGSHLTPIGGLLRKTSLDELPQLWSIVRGDMSLVGPRPALYNQHDLIALRSERGVNGRDELPIPVKVQFDEQYLRQQSFFFDLRILWMTVAKVLGRDGISH
jgi:O-antigen biosynthesis protein WbqP